MVEFLELGRPITPTGSPLRGDTVIVTGDFGAASSKAEINLFEPPHHAPSAVTTDS